MEHADSVAERMRTMQTLLVAGMCVLSLAAVSALLRGGPNVGSAVFPYVAMLAEHAIAYALARKGHLRLAVVVHVTLYLAVVALVMFRFGGIRSPAGFVLPPIVLLAGLTWNGRAALVTAGAAALLTLTLVVLERRGLLPPATGPDAVRLGLVIAATLLITGAILAAALRIIESAKSLLNLVGNASDAMPTPGVVTLRTAHASAAQLARVPGWGAGAAGAVALQVIDTGEGMSPDVKARVFEPFFTTKAPGRGSGIGLAAVHGIVEQSGGTILVDSEPGKGSTFTILLPNVAAR